MALLGFWPALGVDAAIWPAWSATMGVWAARVPDRRLAEDGPVTRLRGWERGGLLYGRLGVRRWKGWLPDFGPVFGGRRKSLTGPRDPASWELFALETRRAEWVHWAILLALPLEAALNDGVVLAPMAAYALAANLPCIAAQRYNRGRLQALVARRRRRPRPVGHGVATAASV